MRCAVFLLLGSVLLGGCTSSHSPAPVGECLADNHRIPSEVLRDHYAPELWQEVLHRRYAGYVVLRGVARGDGSVRITGVREAYPSADRNALAEQLAADIKLTTVRIGSRGPVGVEIFVIFYDSGWRQALVFACQDDSVAPTQHSHGVVYLARKAYE